MSFIYNGIEYDTNRVLTRYRYIPLNTYVDITFSTGTPQNTEAETQVSPPRGYKFAIKYFIISTPPEVQANIIATGIDGTETLLLNDNQEENSVYSYKASNWDVDFLLLDSFKLYGVVSATQTTADRTINLKWGGGFVKGW